MEIEARLESHIELKHGVLHNIPRQLHISPLKGGPARAGGQAGRRQHDCRTAGHTGTQHCAEARTGVRGLCHCAATVGKLELLSYEINFRMPADVIGDLTQLIRLKKVNPYRVVRVTCPFIEGDGPSIRLTVDSNSNPFIRTVYTSSHLEIEGLGITTRRPLHGRTGRGRQTRRDETQTTSDMMPSHIVYVLRVTAHTHTL